MARVAYTALKSMAVGEAPYSQDIAYWRTELIMLIVNAMSASRAISYGERKWVLKQSEEPKRSKLFKVVPL